MPAPDSETKPAESELEDSDRGEKSSEGEDEKWADESGADALDKALDEEEEEEEEAPEEDEEEEAPEEDEEDEAEEPRGGNSGNALNKLPGIDTGGGPPPLTKKGGSKGAAAKPSRPIVTSGILDMRKLAAAYERELGASAAARPADVDEDPPMLIGSADLSGPQVMLPTAEPSGGENRAMLLVLGAILAVILIGITAVVTILLVRHLGKDDGKPPVAQTANPGDQPAANPGPAVKDTPGTDPVNDDGPSGDIKEPAGDIEEPTGDVKVPVAKRDDKRDDKRDRDRPKDDVKKDDPPKDDVKKDDPPKDDVKKDDPPKDPPKDDAKKDACDEYVCLIEPDKPCCKKKAAKEDTPKPKADTPSMPERPSSSEISNGFAKMKPKLQGCADKHDFRGTAKVKVSIAPDGSVTNASTNAGTGIFQNCIAGAAKRVSFSESQKGTTATYALVSR